METTLWRGDEKTEDGRLRSTLRYPNAAREIYRLITETDACLPDAIRQGWRWRIVYLRAVCDYELYYHNYIPSASPRIEACLRELTELYHAHDARIQRAVRPPLGE